MERIAKNIFPYLGNRPIAEITPPELLAVLRKIEIRSAVDQAHRVRGICSLIFRYAIATGRAERDTAADLPGALKSHTVTPRAAITDPEAIGGLLQAIDDFTGTYTVKAGLQLLALTFLRPSEVRLGEFAILLRKERDCLPTEINEEVLKQHLDDTIYSPGNGEACHLLFSRSRVRRRVRLAFTSCRSMDIGGRRGASGRGKAWTPEKWIGCCSWTLGNREQSSLGNGYSIQRR